MFSIRRIYDDTTPTNRDFLRQVEAILRVQFKGIAEKDVRALSRQLRDPLKHRFKAILFVAERRSAVHGFAVLLHLPDLNFCYLDFISAGAGQTGGGIGGALYERVRDEALELGATGIFLECLPDDPELSPDPKVRAENEARLRFYERYGAFPIINTAYETPLKPGDTDPPYLVFDSLGADVHIGRDRAKEIIYAILDRKYGKTCPKKYVQMVLDSIVDDPVQLRPARYLRKRKAQNVSVAPRVKQIALVINNKHDIHHVRERGYVESPVRVKVISEELQRTALFEPLKALKYGKEPILAVHDKALVSFLKKAGDIVGAERSVYPYVFPQRNHARPPKELPLRAGYYCIDTFTPINSNAYLAARAAVDCTMTAADAVLEGHHFAYALVRPPGHHAERSSFGGFCYFNSAAIAANYLSDYGAVALLDIDYHHGNGSQDIFYERADVLTISIHANPRTTYPYFSGFEDEKGKGAGEGFNINLVVPEALTGEQYREALRKALRHVKKFGPRFLVLSLGLDTAKDDPTGSFLLRASDFFANGELIGQLSIPTLIAQEGGYRTRTLGINARNFFQGLWQGYSKSRPHPPELSDGPAKLTGKDAENGSSGNLKNSSNGA
jgi:acetoin utilization deacetylase AcuC-like enzyme/GNAT superfamily N-acetyltransferase